MATPGENMLYLVGGMIIVYGIFRFAPQYIPIPLKLPNAPSGIKKEHVVPIYQDKGIVRV